MSQRHFVIRVIYFIKYIKLPSALINLELSVVEILVKKLFYLFFSYFALCYRTSFRSVNVNLQLGLIFVTELKD